MIKFDPNKTSATAELRKHIDTFLKDAGISGHYYKAPNAAIFPYITWELRQTSSFDDSDESKYYVLEINGYNDTGELIIDKIFDFIQEQWNNYVVSTDIMFLQITLNFGRIDVDEENPIKRKRMLFNLKYWYKEC